MGFFDKARGRLKTRFQEGRARWQALPEERKDEIKEGVRTRMRNYWNSLSEEEKERIRHGAVKVARVALKVADAP